TSTTRRQARAPQHMSSTPQPSGADWRPLPLDLLSLFLNSRGLFLSGSFMRPVQFSLFPSIFLVLPASTSTPCWCWYTRERKPFVKPKIPHRLSRIKSDLATKCRTKPRCDFVVSRSWVFSARNGFMRIQRTTFPQRACERCAQDCKQQPIIRSCSRHREMPVLEAR